MRTVFTNGRIYSMNDDREVFNTMVVEDGVITEMSNESVNTDGADVVDLNGKFVYPGFNDSHMHLLNYGYARSQADLIGITSKSELVERLTHYIEGFDVQEGQWIVGRGWNNDYFTDDTTFPNRFDLDKVSTEVPIAITRTCGHALSVNSKALELIGIDMVTEQPEGGQIDVDGEGRAIGAFRENALPLVQSHITRPTREQIKEMILNATAEMNSYGLTSVQSDDLGSIPGYSYKEILEIFEEMSENGELNIRVYEQCRLKGDTLKEFLDAGYTTGVGNEYFKIGPLKLFLDGSLGARTAAMREGYSDDDNEFGLMTATEEEIDEMVGLAFDHNMQVAAHGIGDRAIETAIRCVSKNRRDDLRNGIIHSQITDMPMLESFRDNKLIAYVQPIFLDYDWHIVRDRVGDRTDTSYAWKTLIDLGVPTSFGTDCPVEHFNPYHNIYEAVTRRDLKGEPAEGFLPEQALTVDESIRAYTYEGAYASHSEEAKGTLDVGKVADFVVLNEDLYEVDPNHIKDMNAYATYLNGREVYRAN